MNATLATAAEYYHLQLARNSSALQYLMKRGVLPETAAIFNLGFAPHEPTALSHAFFSSYSSPDLLAAGLVIDTPRGRRDRFCNRLIFPIYDDTGKLSGFGGRVTESGNRVKYINSPDTDYFVKGNILYNFQNVNDKDVVYVVEGYFDVITLTQSGISAVSPMGTALTLAQSGLLLMHPGKKVFCFDGDSAGIHAAFSAVSVIYDFLVDPNDISFVLMDDEHDPDSYVREFGAEQFIRLHRYSVLDMLLRLFGNHSGPQLAAVAVPWIKRAINQSFRNELIRAVADRSGFSFEDIQRFSV